MEQLRAREAGLLDVVGDPEKVVDRQGLVPAERRETAYIHLGLLREAEVRRLREDIPRRRQELATADEGGRTQGRYRLEWNESLLSAWLAMPQPEPADLCADCNVPLQWHEEELRPGRLGGQECPHWPEYAERNHQLRDKLSTILAASPEQPTETSALKTLKRTDPRTKAQLLEEIDRLTAELRQQEGQ